MGQRTKRRGLIWLLLLVVGQAFCVGFGPPRLAAHDLDPLALSAQQVRQMATLAPPEVQAAAALLMDVGTQTVLYERGADERRAPASTTKMMTALVALKHGDLSDEVTVQAGDLSEWSAAGLTPGETLTLEDLLYVLLLPSDNAAALVIARHIAGSTQAFVDLMNAQAAEWGLQGTHYANPHGLDDPQQYTTARDLAQIALHGLENPVFAAMVNTPERQVGSHSLRNTNELLGSYEGVAGVKTGTTDEAGQCLVALASRPEGQVLCVVLGADDRYAPTRALLDYYFANYQAVTLALGPKGLNRVYGPDGQEGVLVLRDRRQVLLPDWQVPWLRLVRDSHDGQAGESAGPAGTARFTVGSKSLAELPVFLSAP